MTTGGTLSENNIKDQTLSYRIQVSNHGSNDNRISETGRFNTERTTRVHPLKNKLNKNSGLRTRMRGYGCWRGRMLGSPVVMQSFPLNRRLALACAATKMHRLQKGVWYRMTTKA